MRVIDNHRKWLLAIDTFESSWDVSEQFDAVGNLIGGASASVGGHSCGKNVVDIYPSDQAREYRDLIFRGDDVEARAAGSDFGILGVKISAIPAIGEDQSAALTAELDQFRAVLVVQICGRNAGWLGSASLKQNPLGGEIFVHGFVIVEVITGEISEHRDVEGNAEYALLRERVRGDFHHSFSCAMPKRLVQHARELERFRRGVRRGIDLTGNVIFDSADERALAMGRGKNRFDQECGRALAVCSSNSRDGEALCRALVEIRADASQSSAPVGNYGPCHVRTRRFGR